MIKRWQRPEKVNQRDLQLKKIIMMMRGLYMLLALVTLVVAVVGGLAFYSGEELLPANQLVFLLLVLMAVLLLFNGYFVFRDTNLFKRLNSQIEIKDESYRNIEALNLELRAQRHDFLNHIQILYSLMELEAYEDTTDYLNRLYGDVGKLSANIKTASVAFNALLQAKANEAETRQVLFETSINSRLDEMNMPDWELCRVIGNMIDNGFRAAEHTEVPKIGVEVNENITDYELLITNTSLPIEEGVIKSFFAPGFTTKREGEGHGMGLYISDELMRKYNNSIRMTYDEGMVTVKVIIHKRDIDLTAK